VADLLGIPQHHEPIRQQAHAPTVIAFGSIATGKSNETRFQFSIDFPLLWPLRLPTTIERICISMLEKALSETAQCGLEGLSQVSSTD